MNWLFTKRSVLMGNVQKDLDSLEKFDVIYTELSELLSGNGLSWLFVQNLKPHHTLVLWINVQRDIRSHWLANFGMANIVNEKVRLRRANLILHTPTDPIYLDWAQEFKVKCVQTWLAFPFARRLEWRSRTHPEATGTHWSFNLRRREFELLMRELDSTGIIIFGLNDNSDCMLSKLAAAAILRHIPAMIKDDSSTFWRTVTLGGKDCSIYASAPIAFDESSLSLLLCVGRSNWTRFRKTWIKPWISWVTKMQEFWHEQEVSEKFKEVFGRDLFLDWAALHHFYLFDADGDPHA